MLGVCYNIDNERKNMDELRPIKIAEIQIGFFGDYSKISATEEILQKLEQSTGNYRRVPFFSVQGNPSNGEVRSSKQIRLRNEVDNSEVAILLDRLVISKRPNKEQKSIDIDDEIRSMVDLSKKTASVLNKEKAKEIVRMSMVIREIIETNGEKPQLPDFVEPPKILGERQSLDGWGVEFSKRVKQKINKSEEVLNNVVEYNIVCSNTVPRKFALLKHVEMNTLAENQTPRFMVEDFDKFYKVARGMILAEINDTEGVK